LEIVTHYSNTPELLSDLRRTVEAVTELTVEDDEPDLSITAPGGRPWQIKDRLCATDIEQLIESFEAGMTIPELVARYGICRSSVKTLLRRRGVRRHPRSGSSP